ncbi:MAG: arginyltransferase [Candidatus Aminicenantes bacterium]|nr:MAG: arginyltransferase [Candidatus Aminicenantes bacterium]
MSIKGVLLQPVIEECPYLEYMISISETLLIKDMEDQDHEMLLGMGYRHFGEIFFRPLCKHCRKCISIRIPVQQFSPSKSVRRLYNRNKHFNVTLEQPVPTIESFELYNQHKRRFRRQIYESYELYVKSFFHPFTFNRMLAIKDGTKLAALSHLDITANTMSAVYCYFDEKYARFSPGKYSVYKEIEIAKAMGIEWLYLGYYVPGNRHTRYKLQFKPNQAMTEDFKWIDHMDASGHIVNPLPLPSPRGVSGGQEPFY